MGARGVAARVAKGGLRLPPPTSETALARNPVPSRTLHHGSVSISDARLHFLLRLAPAKVPDLTAARAV